MTFYKYYLVKGNKTREVSAQLAAELMYRYTVIGSSFNRGQILYLAHAKNRSRCHALIIARDL
jgi:hypothetical protein